MTEPEVRAILGKPWEDSLLDPEGPSKSYWERAVDSIAFLPDVVRREFTYNRSWIGDNTGLFVAFDDNGRVAFTKLCADPDRPRTWLPARVWRRLRARYGW